RRPLFGRWHGRGLCRPDPAGARHRREPPCRSEPAADRNAALVAAMIAGPPAASPARILVQVDAAAVARWTLWLVEALERRPATQVCVRIVERNGRDGNSALATLLVLERML